MWAIVKDGVLIGTRGNLPSHDLVTVLRQAYSDAVIWRSVEVCHDAFGALAFAKQWVPRQIEKTDAEGVTYTETVSELEPVGNTIEFSDGHLIVRDKMGAVIGSFKMEIAHDGNTAH